MDSRMYAPLYNYAYDNIISRHSHTMNVVKKEIKADGKLSSDRFDRNEIIATISKFQTIYQNIVTTKQLMNWIYQTIQYTTQPSSLDKLSGVSQDDKLCFDDHKSRSCTRTVLQLLCVKSWLYIYMYIYISHDCRLYDIFKTIWHLCSNWST